MKYKKFIGLALAATVLGTSSSFAADSFTVSSSKLNPKLVIEQSKKIDISEIAPNVNITYNILTKKELIKNGGGEVNVIATSQNCSININVDEDFHTGGMGSPWMEEKIGKTTSLSSPEQEQIRTEFAVLHEASHCNLYNTKSPFSYSSNKDIQDTLNKYYVLSGTAFDGKNNFASVYSSLQENFADTLASLLIIKKYGMTKDVIEVISKTKAEREELAITFKKFGYDQHSTNYSLEQILKEDTASFVKNNSINKIIEYSKELATVNALKSINSYTKIDNVVNINSISSGILSLAVKVMYSKVINKPIDKNIELNLDTNPLYASALNVVKNIEDTKKKQLNSEEDVYHFVNKNASKIGELSFIEAKKLLASDSSNIINKDDGTITSLKELPTSQTRDYASIKNELIAYREAQTTNNPIIKSGLKP